MKPKQGTPRIKTEHSISLLDVFAGQALAGLCANPDYSTQALDEAAGTAYSLAAWMLIKRKEYRK